MADGYGVGLFDSTGPENFAKSIGKITSALTGVQSAFSSFGSTARTSIGGLTQLVDSLTKSLSGLQTQIQQVQSAVGGMGGGGGGGGGGGPSTPSGAGSGGVGARGLVIAGKNWVSPSGGGPGGYDQGPTGGAQGGRPMDPGTAGAINDQLKDVWTRMPEQTPKPQTQQSMTNAPNGGGGGGMLQRAAQSLPAAAFGAAVNTMQPGGWGASMVSAAVQGQWIGANIGAAYGATGAQQRSMYVIPGGTYAQSAADYAQSNQYMQMYMGANPFQNPNTIAGQNAAAFNRGAQQLMTLNPTMTRQQAMVAQNQMQQPGVLNAGLMFGLNFKPGGKAMDSQTQMDMIFNKLFAGFPGGRPSGDQFASYMAPGGPGENNLAALGITPGSDMYASFMTYAQAKIGLSAQGKAMPSNIGTKAGAKAMGGVGNTAAYAQLQAQSAKSRMESQAEPGLASAAKNLNDAAAALFKAVTPLSALAGGGIGKLFGGQGLLGGVMNMIPGGGIAQSLIGGTIGKIPGVGGIIKSIFQQGGLVPGSGPQLAVVHGGEYVLTKDDVDKMQGKKGGHGGGNGAGLLAAGAGGGGGQGGNQTIGQLLAAKPSDAAVTNTVLGQLLNPLPGGSAIAQMFKPGAQQGAGKTAAPAQAGGKGNAGVTAVGGLDRVMSSLGIQPGTPAAANLTALLGGTLAGGGAGTGGAASTTNTGTAANAATTSPWNYKSAGLGPMDLSGMFAPTSQTSDGSGSGSGGSGGTGAGAPTNLSGSGNVQQAYNYFLGKGLKDYQAAGILGNLAQESGVDPTRAQAGGPGRGIAQWGTGPGSGQRWDALTAWAKGQNRDPMSLSTQLDYMWNVELAGAYAGVLAQLKGTANVTDATTVFEQGYEAAGTPAMANRISYAQKVLASKGASYARGTQNIARSQLALLHRGEAVVSAADNYSSNPYNKGGAQGNASVVHLNFKSGSIVLQVPPGSSQQDMDGIAKQFVAAISKPQLLASVRSK